MPEVKQSRWFEASLRSVHYEEMAALGFQDSEIEEDWQHFVSDYENWIEDAKLERGLE